MAIKHKEFENLKLPNLLIKLVENREKFRSLLCDYISDIWRDGNCSDEDGDIECKQCLLAEGNLLTFNKWLKPTTEGEDDGDLIESNK